MLDRIIHNYAEFAGLTLEERVHINVNTVKMAEYVNELIKQKGGDLSSLELHQFPTNVLVSRSWALFFGSRSGS